MDDEGLTEEEGGMTFDQEDDEPVMPLEYVVLDEAGV